jgi:hypothetical protein
MKKSLLLLAAAVCALGSGSEVGIELLPSGRAFRPTFADPREIRMALGFEGDSHLHASVGNYFSLLGFQPVESPTWRIHFGLEGAGYFTMRSEGSRFPLETTDGLIGIYIEGDSGPWQAQFRYTHVSAHLSDGTSGQTAIPYSRETASLRVAYAPTGHTQLYTGLHYLAHTVPVLPRLGFQVGGSWFVPWGVSKLVPFVATDVKWKAETLINPSWSFQLGLAVNNPPQAYRSFRFFYAYYTGADPRGQFLFRVYTAHSFGIEMQI